MNAWDPVAWEALLGNFSGIFQLEFQNNEVCVQTPSVQYTC